MHNTYYKSKKAKITERACYSITIDTYNSIITIILYNGAPHPTWLEFPFDKHFHPNYYIKGLYIEKNKFFLNLYQTYNVEASQTKKN